jgi:SpoVK/Ycf46/Vps4 family AAA+-type ATPase
MSNISIDLVGQTGEPLGRLRQRVPELIQEAEKRAKDQILAKRSALSLVLKEYIEQANLTVDTNELALAVKKLDSVRRGESQDNIQVTVGSISIHFTSNQSSEFSTVANRSSSMPPSSTVNGTIQYFEAERKYPDKNAYDWYERLVGLDEQKSQLLVELELLLFPEKVKKWSELHHGKILKLCEIQSNRVPLILFEGDVGTGKTALAETIGDALARRIDNGKDVHLLKMNTQVRGSGLVGEMSDLIVQAFTQAEARAKALGGDTPLLLLLDEADALAGRRDNNQMHHEDKAGLNTVLQRLDNLRILRLPIAVLFITNRPDALDPAIRRRAALDLLFERPTDLVRAEILKAHVPELNLSSQDLAQLVRLTGENEAKNKGVQFTASDITERLLAGALRKAYTEKRALAPKDLLELATALAATPKMGTS